MSNASYEDAIKFLEYLKQKLPDWTYDNWDNEIEYIQEVLADIKAKGRRKSLKHTDLRKEIRSQLGYSRTVLNDV